MKDDNSIAADLTLKHHLLTNKLYCVFFLISYLCLFLHSVLYWSKSMTTISLFSFSFIIILQFSMLLLQGNYTTKPANPSRGECYSMLADQIKHLTQIAERDRTYSRLTHSLFLRLLNNSWIKQNTTNTLRRLLPGKLIPQNEIELYLAAQIEAIMWY